jgi:phosphohistidine phosphatase
MNQPEDEGPRVLYLLRHAKSSWQEGGLDDRARPLNERGHHAAHLVAAHLARQTTPDLVLCSSALRTRETFEHIARAFATSPRVSFEDALYLANARALLARIEAVDDNVMTLLAIGHNPGLHELASGLARHGPRHDRARLAAKFPTAALASFRLAGPWRGIGYAPIALSEFIVPSDLDATETDTD